MIQSNVRSYACLKRNIKINELKCISTMMPERAFYFLTLLIIGIYVVMTSIDHATAILRLQPSATKCIMKTIVEQNFTNFTTRKV